MADRIERAFTGVLAIATLILAGAAVRREFFPTASARPMRTEAPTVESDWKDALPVGIRVGDSTARVTMVVFNDLECPACQAFHRTTNAIQDAHPKDVSLVYVHFPLPMHRFAGQAAQAAECANKAGRFREFVNAVFTKQDSLGMKSWGSYAQEAGILDTAAITRCAHDPSPVQRIEAGRALALRWELVGTPTVIINGRRYASSPSREEVERVVQELLADPHHGQVTASVDASVAQQGEVGSIPRSTGRVPKATLRDSNIVAQNVMRLLFTGIRLSSRQEDHALTIIKRTWRDQFALSAGSPADHQKRAAALNVARDSALEALLISAADRTTFERRAGALRNGTPLPN